MSGFKDLEEYTDTELKKELVRRSQRRAGCACPYCSKPLSNDRNICRLHERGGVVTGDFYEQVFAKGDTPEKENDA